MQELLQVAVNPINIVYTVLLAIILLYWVTVILGALDMNAFDIDIDNEVDIDAEVDADSDIDGDGVGWLAGTLHFFNFGKLPFMIILSFVIVSAWAISILANHYWNPDGALGFALAIIFPNLFVSLLITKAITTPLVPVFKNLDGGSTPVDYIGQTCKILLPASNARMGQAEVEIDGNCLLVNVKMDKATSQSILRGEEAVIVRQSPDERYFIVEKMVE